MEAIIDLPDGVELDADGPFRLVRVEYAKGGEDVDSVDVFDRAEWLSETRDDATWRALATQQIGDLGEVEDPNHRLVRVTLPGWWVSSEAEEADPQDVTWQRSYGEVYGQESTLAVLDYEWSAERAAWSFPTVRNKDGRWHSPGKYGPGGPKSLLPVVFPVGVPDAADTAEVSVREAREAAPKGDDSVDYDWETAIEAARKRAESRYEAEDEELDTTAIASLEAHGKAVHRAGNKALVRFNDQYKEDHGVPPDPVTLSAASEAIAHGLRESKGLTDPREEE